MQDKPSITRVSILYRGKNYSLPPPYRHHHVIQWLARNCDTTRWLPGERPHSQGFTNSLGIYVDRLTAAKQFVEAGQEIIPPMHTDELYSENAWGTPGKWWEELGHPERTLYDFHEDHDRIDSLMTATPYEGGYGPYRFDICYADYFAVEGKAIDLEYFKKFYGTWYIRRVVSPVLYSELFKTPLPKNASKKKRLGRIKIWMTHWVKAEPNDQPSRNTDSSREPYFRGGIKRLSVHKRRIRRR